jgi:hypothetical protein
MRGQQPDAPSGDLQLVGPLHNSARLAWMPRRSPTFAWGSGNSEPELPASLAGGPAALILTADGCDEARLPQASELGSGRRQLTRGDD